MAISEIIKFAGPSDALIWKFPHEDFTVTSQLIVDETHEALLVINGNAADLFPPGRRTLAVPNIPLANKLINIPTGGENPFPCKVFFINKVHQMDLLWGTQGPVALEDPEYEIFMHVMLNGSMSISVENSRKFILKFVGFKDAFDSETLIQKFRGIISSHVKDSISKIMINGKLSYFKMNASLFEISSVVKEKLDAIFEEYGILIRYFNIESISVPDQDYDAITKAKERRSSRIIEGYSWQEQRQMDIAEKFAGNEGTMGNVGGAVGGFMMGGALGGSIVDIARSALSTDLIPTEKPPKDVASSSKATVSTTARPFNVSNFFEEKTDDGPDQPSSPTLNTVPADKKSCPKCGALAPKNAKFCFECGEKFLGVCPNCNAQINSDSKFCSECGTKLS
ncbi:MAG: SPFH domain-containing protein [Chloroflexota bacterium]